MHETPFQNPRGGYFTMNDRGRLIEAKQYNPNNVHIGERYYGRQGPIGNPRMAGYDNGNTRVPNTMPPIGGPFVPFGGMDYTGKNTGMQMAMNKGMDNWGGNLGGTFEQEGYGDPGSSNPWGGYEEPPYSYDNYDDDVLDPGFGGNHAMGPLYFGV